MTIQFSGVHFLYKPAADERRFVESAQEDVFREHFDITLQDKGDVLVLNTGTPEANFMDGLVLEGLQASERPTVSELEDGNRIEGFHSASKRKQIRDVIMGDDSLTLDQLKAARQPNYFVLSGDQPFSDERIDALAAQLNRDGKL